MLRPAVLTLMAACCCLAQGRPRQTLNFDLDWQLHVGDLPAETFNSPRQAAKAAPGRTVSLPRAFNGEEAFARAIYELTDTVMWYYKTFRLSKEDLKGKILIEFEGTRQGTDVYLNGQHVGLHENGVMAFGMDLTPYARKGDNLIAVRVDNSWTYRERGRKYSRYQWNDRNFNANYGGIPKHVRLHLLPSVYQTLPLYSNLGTTGTYIYATGFDLPARQAEIHAESQVRNESAEPVELQYEVQLLDAEGHPVRLADGQGADGTFRGDRFRLMPGETRTFRAQATARGLHFWSWGYGYLYTVVTRLTAGTEVVDEAVTRTGFRQTRFAEGKVWLNGRVIQMKGYAQRTSNEWPATGMSVPPWLSDYSNALMVESGANLVRWMHVTPWKQDVESCDRVGLLQAMPAGDAERDVSDRRWEQRVMLMRDAIIYNRNNPSIIFYECGNKGISPQHMEEMRRLRDLYDPHGGRAIGSREMLDVESAEYGGEMLYVNKSAGRPFWAMEYSRDEAMRRYQDNWTWPYHRNGDGPLYKNADASAYNQNQDMLAVEHVRRWFDFWRERPGTGRRVSSGGVKIVFSDTNTHSRGESNYRTSGVTDAMRIPKESFYAHQVMWNGWVDNEQEDTHIIGHWNYAPGTVKPVHVVSTAPVVELRLNGRFLGRGRRQYHFLHTFDSVAYAPGTLVALGTDHGGQLLTADTLHTTGQAVALRMSLMQAPDGFHADGADMALVQVEAVDAEGRRCPTDYRRLEFGLEGPAEYLGGIAGNREDDPEGTPRNYILSRNLPLECGVTRVLVRSTRKPGTVTLSVRAEGLPEAVTSWTSLAVDNRGGRSTYFAQEALEGRLTQGETPDTPSYTDTRISLPVASVSAGSNPERAAASIDDNERTEWSDDGRRSTAWITYHLDTAAVAHEACLKMAGWRTRSYPIEIYADSTLVWSGNTPHSLGYVHLRLRPVKASDITIRLQGSIEEKDAFGQITELEAANEEQSGPQTQESRHELRIVEAEFLHDLVPADDDAPSAPSGT